jgi:hypothetical protein
MKRFSWTSFQRAYADASNTSIVATSPAEPSVSSGTVLDTCKSIVVRNSQCLTLQKYPHPSSRKNTAINIEEIARWESLLGSEMADGDRNAVWYDGEGRKVVHYFPHFLDGTVRESLKQAFRDLLKEYTPSKPSPSEKRSTRYEEWKAHLGENTLSGVIRLTFHHQQQHSHDEAAGASADFLGRSVKKTTAAIRFRKAQVVQNIATWVSILFAAIDPPTWRHYREAYQLAVSHDPVLQNCDHGPAHCFVGHYLVINMLTTPHYDTTDPPTGWVAMAIVGDYTDGQLVIPELGIVLPYRTGDIVFIRSWMLVHFIREYSGSERFVIVFSTTYSIFEWVRKTF